MDARQAPSPLHRNTLSTSCALYMRKRRRAQRHKITHITAPRRSSKHNSRYLQRYSYFLSHRSCLTTEYIYSYCRISKIPRISKKMHRAVESSTHPRTCCNYWVFGSQSRRSPRRDTRLRTKCRSYHCDTQSNYPTTRRNVRPLIYGTTARLIFCFPNISLFFYFTLHYSEQLPQFLLFPRQNIRRNQPQLKLISHKKTFIPQISQKFIERHSI